MDKKDFSKMSMKEWLKILDSEQFMILREEATEPAHTSELNDEKRKGDYFCAGCNTKLFSSETKYNSGSGWPSFYDSLPGVFKTKTDHVLGYPRTEYHCATCEGHHGHIFEDGPEPTGKRFCNNGKTLIFKKND